MLFGALKRLQVLSGIYRKTIEMGLDTFVGVTGDPHVVNDYYNLHGLPVATIRRSKSTNGPSRTPMKNIHY
jgi:hypothetical protein